MLEFFGINKSANMRKNFLLGILLVLFSSQVIAESYFHLLKLPRGVEVQVPRGWWLLGKDYNRMIQTTAEAGMDLSGTGLSEGSDVNLIAANSMPRTTYAALRINSITPASLIPEDVSNLSEAMRRKISLYMKTNVEKSLPLIGLRLLNFYGTHTDRISGCPALVTRYRRSGPKGPVIVEINQVITNKQQVKINLSYRESEKPLWFAVIGKIRSSIRIK